MGECFFWYRPTRVVPEKEPLNGCVYVCVLIVQLPVENSTEKFLCCWLCTSGPISASAQTDRRGYCPGMSVSVSLVLSVCMSLVLSVCMSLVVYVQRRMQTVVLLSMF